MSRIAMLLCGSALVGAYAQGAAAQTTVGEVVVTAQKVTQKINDVGMSVQAASGDKLTRLGVTDVSQLTKIVPGLSYVPSMYDVPDYSIRGIGYLDVSLAGSPTVSIYQDQIPLPYSIMTAGVALDLERVEILKGPQGTLFGENATGGAINFIANKPKDHWQAGFDASYGNFNTTDIQAFVSGPINDTLTFRIAGRTIQSGDWQSSYTHPASWGAKNFWNGRGELSWMPNARFTALLTLSGFVDRGDTQMAALRGLTDLSPTSTLDPRIKQYPVAPHRDGAADGSACINNSIFDPPFGSTPIGAQPPTTPTTCVAPKKNNSLFTASLRMDYDFGDDIVLTSLTGFNRYTRNEALDGDGTIYQVVDETLNGGVQSIYQELRLAGKFSGKGSWIAGGNYGHDSTFESDLGSYMGSTFNPLAIPGSSLCAIPHFCSGVNLSGVPQNYLYPFLPARAYNRQRTDSYAVFASAEYPIRDDVILQAGVRYTQTNKSYQGCGLDAGSGSFANFSQGLQDLFELLNGRITPTQYLQPGAFPGGNGINPGPGGCGTAGPGPTYNPPPSGQLYAQRLDENNVSWRVGANWKPRANTLVYLNVTQGWKAGSYPSFGASISSQYAPAVQEGLLAYEVGFKTRLRRNLQLNGAGYYYDYTNKQIFGDTIDPVFGALLALVNVPKSHVVGFELSAEWQPITGLTVTPAMNYESSEVDGCSKVSSFCINGKYHNYDSFGQFVNLTGESFPSAPQWQADLDVEYDWTWHDNWTAFAGVNLNYQSDTNAFFYNRAPFPTQNSQPPRLLDLAPYVLLDLRAGVRSSAWNIELWGRNVTDTYYWTNAARFNDVIVRYNGMPATYGVTVSYRLQ